MPNSHFIFLCRCVDDVDEEKDSGIQVPLLALQIAKVHMSKQKMVTDLVSYLLELIAKRDPGNPMVKNTIDFILYLHMLTFFFFTRLLICVGTT